MNYWIFKCNPDHYHLADRLADPDSNTTWAVTRYKREIETGDIAFVWETGPNRGIRAIVQIDSFPREMAELENEQRYLVKPDREIRLRVLCTFTNRGINLSQAEIQATPGLENLSVFHGWQQGTNFRVEPAEGETLLRLIVGQLASDVSSKLAPNLGSTEAEK